MYHIIINIGYARGFSKLYFFTEESDSRKMLVEDRCIFERRVSEIVVVEESLGDAAHYAAERGVAYSCSGLGGAMH